MAGEVAAVGAQAEGFAVGDRVYSILGGGGYAEAVAADPSYLMPLPDALSFTEGRRLARGVPHGLRQPVHGSRPCGR